jgi:hypothetical protein
MNRRKFFKFIGKALGAVAIAPILPPVEIEQSEDDVNTVGFEPDILLTASPSPSPKYCKFNGLGDVWESDNGEDWEQVLRSGYFGAGSSGLEAPIADWDSSSWSTER